MATMEEVMIDSTRPDIKSELDPVAPVTSDTNNPKKRNLRQRNGGVYYGIFNMSSDDEFEYILTKKDLPFANPKRSNDAAPSSKRSRREKELPQWRPDEGCRPQVEEAPVFYPTEEEFKDTLGYIARIRPQAEKYGICCIVPPSTWTPPCPLLEKDFWERIEFTTRVQQVDKLQNREPIKKRCKTHLQKRKRRRKRFRFSMQKRRNNNNNSNNDCTSSENKDEGNESESEEKFGFQNGSDFTLEEFKDFADKFKDRHFRVKGDVNCSHSDNVSSSCTDGSNTINTDNIVKEKWSPSVEEIEGEYWRIVEEADQEIEVHYGADLDTVSFGSGFQKANSQPIVSDKYVRSGWNLNNLPRLAGSVLSFEKEQISGVVVPWLYVGMCFSSFCWHVEDHHLYSLNYMHFGEPKVWYGVAGSKATKLEEAMRKHLPKLFEEQPGLLHELVTQLSPTVLKSEGVNVYRAVQRPGQFILTFPHAYHAGFNCGFNCAEAVNVAPADWLPLGQCAVESYREQKRKTSISHDKLLLEVAKAAVWEIWVGQVQEENGLTERSCWWKTQCGKDGVLTRAIKDRIEMERKARKNLNCHFQLRKMESTDNTSTERECFSCFYDLYISRTKCECNPSRFACLHHAELLCSCEPSKRIAFFRYDLEELNILLSALEGDLSAVKKWAEIDPDFYTGLVKRESKVLNLNTEERGTSPQMDCAGSNTHCRARLSSTCSSELMQSDRGQIRKSSPKLFGVDIGAASHCAVELLQIGTLIRGNNWSCKEAIFTKGFKSRVKFHSVIDPTKRCNYICEILDAGLLGPLFKVTLEEEGQDICFTGVSPNQCWDLVKEKLDAEISRLPASSLTEAPEPVNGLEMFGFTSPNIIRRLEALDLNCQCSNYWASKSLPSQSDDTCMKISKTSEDQKTSGAPLIEDEKIYITSNSSPEELLRDQSTLQQFFSKASVEELKVMYRVFASSWGSQSWRSAFEALSTALSDQLMKN